MVIKVGINGFGRVGRIVFRTCLEHPDIEVTAINDPAVEVDYICYLVKYDSTHGTLKAKVTYSEDEIIVNDLSIKVFRHKTPTKIPWQEAGVQYVVEASGIFTSMDKASGHLESESVKRVIVTAPSVDIPMVVLGVNQKKINPECKVISCGSSTLYCLAPIIKVLEDNYGVEEGFITSIHAMTPSLKPLDGLCLKGKMKHWRDHRSITQNIIPAVTGACKALGRVIPSVRNKLCGLAFRVPIVNVSVLDLTVRVKKLTSIENIVHDVEKFKKSIKETIIMTSNDEAVSSDFVGNSHSCILDVGSSLQLNANAFKLICWYENEYSYACRVIDLMFFSEDQFASRPSDVPPYQLNVCIHHVATSENVSIPVEITKVSKGSHKTTNVRPKHNLMRRDMVLQTDFPVRHIMQRIEVKTNHFGDKPALKPDNLKPTENPIHLPFLTGDLENKQDLLKVQNASLSCIFENSSKLPESSSKNSKYDHKKEKQILEKVKRKFSKMIDMTESLIKDATNNELDLRKSKEIISAGTSISKQLDDLLETNSTCPKSSKLHALETERASFNPIKEESHKIDSIKACTNLTNNDDDEFDDCIITVPPCITRSMTDEQSLSLCESDETIENAKDIKNRIQQLNISRSFISKTFTNICDGFYKNVQGFSNNISNTVIEEKVTADEVCKSLKQHDNETKSSNTKEDNTSSHDEQNNQLLKSNETVILNKKRMVLLSNKTISFNDRIDVLRQRSVNFEDIGNCSDRNRDYEDNIKHFGDNNNVATGDSSKCNIPLNQEHSFTSVAVSYALTSEDVSRCSDSDNKSKRDIYDKLDSDSGSETDFENIEGKKSQIIEITDLTNSLEDLDRLDKICKIMEISDELSDKLFSVLDSKSDTNNITREKWSFKDLCEKINFDEFCTKVFGK